MAKQKIALVIDDEAEIVEVVRDLLKEELHYLVLSATDPKAAVDLAQSYLFDLLILDLHMPSLDGFRVLNLVRSKQHDVKVMVITGLYERYKDRLAVAQVDKVVEKPFDFERFKQDVIELAGEAGAAAKSARFDFVPKAKILLVDDEREQSECLKDFLLRDQPNRYQVEIAETAEDGIALTNDFEPDLVLFDLKMPHMLGDEMMQRIQTDGGHQPRHFIVVSAVALPETVKRLRLAGCSYVTKPFRIEILLDLVRDQCYRLSLGQRSNEAAAG